MNAMFGWGLAVLAVVVGYVGFGWQGVVLAVTVVVFWMLLQFSRSLRVLQKAAGQPVGSVDNAVMLYAKVHPGQNLPQVLALTRSLGRKVADEPHEAFAWSDNAGDELVVTLRGGRVVQRELRRAAAAAEVGTAASDTAT